MSTFPDLTDSLKNQAMELNAKLGIRASVNCIDINATSLSHMHNYKTTYVINYCSERIVSIDPSGNKIMFSPISHLDNPNMLVLPGFESSKYNDHVIVMTIVNEGAVHGIPRNRPAHLNAKPAKAVDIIAVSREALLTNKHGTLLKNHGMTLGLERNLLDTGNLFNETDNKSTAGLTIKADYDEEVYGKLYFAIEGFVYEVEPSSKHKSQITNTVSLAPKNLHTTNGEPAAVKTLNIQDVIDNREDSFCVFRNLKDAQDHANAYGNGLARFRELHKKHTELISKHEALISSYEELQKDKAARERTISQLREELKMKDRQVKDAKVGFWGSVVNLFKNGVDLLFSLFAKVSILF